MITKLYNELFENATRWLGTLHAFARPQIVNPPKDSSVLAGKAAVACLLNCIDDVQSITICEDDQVESTHWLWDELFKDCITKN